ncbi:hypothetical protein [Thermosulfurimonas sp. F29]|uniref:hypothetical protein n=1 Tax=Thermosulfurimonas sp. F29 TaxID=2867247 RepID=UPI001C835732|nr:hypothetical protein [Thermosulfurimonas sp. F29]MBX6424202.1 hypothetical protein [Thermosulfurimonas sp. F29]
MFIGRISFNGVVEREAERMQREGKAPDEARREALRRVRRGVIAALTGAMLAVGTAVGGAKPASAMTFEELFNKIKQAHIGPAVGAAAGAMLTKKDASDFEKGLAAFIGAAVGQVAEDILSPAGANTSTGARRGVGACRKVLTRVYENGRMVTERVREVCEARTQFQSYDIPGEHVIVRTGSSPSY